MHTVEVEGKPQRKQRPKDKSRVPVPTGPSSLNPGTWLTNEYEKLAGTDLTSEHARLVKDIVASYRPGLRYRRVYWVCGNDLLNRGKQLETKSLCYAEADISAIRQQIEDSPPFTMMGTPGVLSGVHWLMFREQKRREHELEDYKPKPKRKKRKKQAASETPKPKLRRVSMDELESLYDAWFDVQTEGNWNAFWEAGHTLFSRLATRDHSEDGRKLRDSERDVELVNDFLIGVLSALKSGKRIEAFSHYVSRAWKRRRIDALKDLTEWDRKHVRDVPTDEDADDDERVLSYTDAAMYQDWQIEQRETSDPSEEEREQERETKFSQLDPDLQDFAGVLMTGASEKELCARFNLSRQQVGRQKRKIEAQLQRVVNR